ncbi:MAG: tripartite tricarboxylate transporter permease [Spirochaetales bacterium]|uniref:Tripartite tricarboxylate transporter permease n=1 Tax=Candidatus Thalassospirochaeta sargassi TaxID=3119039 RepID=A0AAJ1IGT5_9SPIO|nr:tripartite tricarboxylate transporter permease [Spirochaetales bacterium]
MSEYIFSALLEVLQIQNVAASAIGVFFGLFIGATPGLTISLGMVLLLPLTYALDPVTSICLLLGLYSAGMTGGSFSAILLNIPGTPSASATAIEGHAMAQNGKASEALSTAIISSFTGGVLGLITLALISPIIAKFALKFGAPELFALVLMGITLICSFGQKSIVKGLMAGVFGLIIMTIGLDPMTGVPRFTFGNVNLQAGINFLPAMIGLFAIPQIISGIATREKVVPSSQHEVKGVFSGFKYLFKRMRSIIIGAVLGTGIGAIPGAGGPIAVFLSYDYAKKLSKNKDNFGKGEPDGVAAPEAANNAVAGGALIPMLTLGIPGDPVTAILLGALMIHGLIPGPLLFETNPQFVFAIFWAVLMANVFNLFISMLSVKVWVKVLKVPQRILLPIILVMCVIGSFSLNNNFFDTGIMFAFGILAYFMKKYGFPIVPLLLAIILGPQLEEHLRMSLIISSGDPTIFFRKPISLVFIIVAVFSFIAPFVTPKIQQMQNRGAEGCDDEEEL